jgi:FAD/FMN-containing dehydrogenase
VLPTRVGGLLGRLEELSDRHSLEHRAGGRAALGVLTVRLPEPPANAPSDRLAAVAGFIEELRTHVEAEGGSAVVAAAGPALRQRVDLWGSTGDALAIMRAVKARFDPNSTLNPGAGPVNL